MSACKVQFRFLALVVLAVLLVGCGSGSNEGAPEATHSQTDQVSSTPEVVEESEKQRDDESGNVITRSLRTGGSWVWSGVTWIWDRGSDGVNAVWEAINSAGSFLWDRVTGLPSTVGEVFQRVWNWVRGSELGERVREVPGHIRERIDELNPVGFIQSLISTVVFIFQLIAVGAVLCVLALFSYKFRIIALIRRALARS